MRRSLRLREKSAIPAVLQEPAEATTTDGLKRLREKAASKEDNDEWHDGDEYEEDKCLKPGARDRKCLNSLEKYEESWAYWQG
ncbi:hypothetical protein BDP27DRAFT_1320719 [Rhodocollybia butyracea]|uniref:Uncharacterized protein n=1 Tax=Rhodocollybia butyracea TaxID=206335 RepID=A0A9P5UAR8_9AGAR|nr:hypothetical protein BDP27DRAFT_1320719 [Rhodocollybia butyracea]